MSRDLVTYPHTRTQLFSLLRKYLVLRGHELSSFLSINSSLLISLPIFFRFFAFQKYCILNGHKLSRIIIWNSATDMAYASNDTLANNIKIYKPDYIIFIIGLNQIYQTRFDNSRVAVNKIIDQFGDIPYTWIGPANWIDDFGINKMYQETVDSGAFFLSKNLVLERAEDGRHPSIKGSKIWVDSICNFLTNKAKYRIKMEKIDTPYKRQKLNILTLNGGKNN